MDASGVFLTGIIEGFYGRSWPWAARQDYSRFLSDLGLNTYLYCPKGDAYLRKRWRDPFAHRGLPATMIASHPRLNIVLVSCCQT